MSEKIKWLEQLFQKQADIIGPCALPDPKTKGTRAIEHIKLVRVEPQPVDGRYDDEDNNAEDVRFIADLEKLGLTPEEIKNLLAELSQN